MYMEPISKKKTKIYIKYSNNKYEYAIKLDIFSKVGISLHHQNHITYSCSWTLSKCPMSR